MCSGTTLAQMSETVHVDLTYDVLNPLKGRQFVKVPEAGAIVSFEGITRGDFNGKTVVHLSYESHERLARKTLESIGRDAIKQFPNLYKVYIVHRLGTVPVEEASILIYVSSKHRQSAWQAGEWILERTKELAEIWKNEVYDDGTSQWKVNDGSRPGTAI